MYRCACKFCELDDCYFYICYLILCSFHQITSYDGIMRYRVSHEMDPDGALIVGTDVQITVSSFKC